MSGSQVTSEPAGKDLARRAIVGQREDGEAMSEGPRGLDMSLPATPENVAVVRHAVTGVAETLGMDEVGIADLKTVVTEACMNVVVHAYPEDSGPLIVEAHPEDDFLTVVVSDFGGGIRPRADLERPSLRLGLSLIAALSQSFEISGGLERGTRITMRVAVSSDRRPSSEAPEVVQAGASETRLTVGPEPLGPVLARVVGALAARRDVTVDRLSDAVLLTDAISADAPSGFTDGRVRIDLSEEEDGIGLRIGPMEHGAAERLRKGLDLPEVGNLESLADELRVEENGKGEYLLVRIAAEPA
jgi:anti-sigma regulatory factor (Ser/Thr protein kinase)